MAGGATRMETISAYAIVNLLSPISAIGDFGVVAGLGVGLSLILLGALASPLV